MMKKTAEDPSVVVSVKFYQVLLKVYPDRFQREYGPDMVQVFRDCCLQAIRQGGIHGLARLWGVTFLDIIQSAISEHLQKEVQVNKGLKSEDTYLAGIGVMLTGIVFPIMSKFNANVILPIVFFCLPLLAVGLLEMRKRYGEKVGWFGRSILLLGAVAGPAISLMGFGSLYFYGERMIAAFLFGMVVTLTCLGLFGIVALFTKPLPRWNFLPLIAGFVFPVSFITSAFSIMPAQSLDIPLGILQGVALVALGYILKNDGTEEITIQHLLPKNMQSDSQLNRVSFNGFAGIAFFLGSVGFIATMTTIYLRIDLLGDVVLFLFIFFITPLLALGLLELHRRYGEKAGWIGRNILLLGGILGPVLSFRGFGVAISRGEDRWIFVYAIYGLVTVLLCLSLFGMVALFKKPLPRWNFLPLVAGIWFPFVVFLSPLIYSFVDVSVVNTFFENFWYLFYALFILQGFALAALGYILRADVLKEKTVPA
ncbi:MAG: hypothetical protein QY328_02980 [Anaerolineales bacterium]|nr:MAG: hypothetical protein QY328_02980 [Anaerolineales bacterium]